MAKTARIRKSPIKSKPLPPRRAPPAGGPKGPNIGMFALLAALAASGLFYLSVSPQGNNLTGAALTDLDIFSLLYGNLTGAEALVGGPLESASVGCTPPYPGPWVISGTSQVVCEDEDINIDGGISIRDTAKLTLINCTLNFTNASGTDPIFVVAGNAAVIANDTFFDNLTGFTSMDSATINFTRCAMRKGFRPKSEIGLPNLMGNSVNYFKDTYFVGITESTGWTKGLYQNAVYGPQLGIYDNSNNTFINCTLNQRYYIYGNSYTRIMNSRRTITDSSMNFIGVNARVYITDSYFRDGFCVNNNAYVSADNATWHGSIGFGNDVDAVLRNSRAVADLTCRGDSNITLVNTTIGSPSYGWHIVQIDGSKTAWVKNLASGRRLYETINSTTNFTVAYSNTSAVRIILSVVSPSVSHINNSNITSLYIMPGAGDDMTVRDMYVDSRLNASLSSGTTAFSSRINRTILSSISVWARSNAKARVENMTGMYNLFAMDSSRVNASRVNVTEGGFGGIWGVYIGHVTEVSTYWDRCSADFTHFASSETAAPVCNLESVWTPTLAIIARANATINASKVALPPGSYAVKPYFVLFGRNHVNFTLPQSDLSRVDMRYAKPGGVWVPFEGYRLGNGVTPDQGYIYGYVDMPNMAFFYWNGAEWLPKILFPSTEVHKRYYPVWVYDASGDPVVGANASIRNPSGGLVSWDLTDANGEATPYAIFGPTTWSQNFTLNVSWNPTYIFNITITTDTPIIINQETCYDVLGGGVCETEGDCECITSALNDSLNCWTEVRMNSSVVDAPNTCAIFGQGEVLLNCSGYAIDGNGTGDGVRADGRSGIAVKECDITDWQTGICLNDVSSSAFSQNSLFNNTDGMYMESSNSNLIEDTIISNSTNGISAHRSDFLNVTGSTISYAPDGIFLDQCDDFEIGGSLISAAGNGVYAQYCIGGTIDGNNITYNGRGIFLDPCSNTTISGNSIARNVMGIFTAGGGGFDIVGNNVTDSAEFGIVAGTSSRIEGNTIVRNNYTGVLAIGHHIVVDNIASFNGAGGGGSGFGDAGQCGIIVVGYVGTFIGGSYLNLPANGSVISLNTANNNAYAGIGVGHVGGVGSSGGLTITANRAGNNTVGIALLNIIDSDFSGNTASDNTAYGLYMDAASGGNALIGNRACNNSLTDVYDNASANSGDDNTCDTVFQWNDTGAVGCTVDCAGCGNTTCDPGENCATCPDDCGFCCGNDACDYGETCFTCEPDCGPCCGNGVLEPTYGEECDNGTENNETCVPDYAETCYWCDENCSIQTEEGESCGDGIINDGEQCDNASYNDFECAPPYNGTCLWCDEHCRTQQNNGTFCGDGACQTDYEYCWTCEEDCGPCTENCTDGTDNDMDGDIDCNDSECACYPSCFSCGDGNCTCGETYGTCPSDCPVPTTTCRCGDGRCNCGETCHTCEDDCGDCYDCSEPWECDPWGPCVNGTRHRECDCDCGDEDDCHGDHATVQVCGCTSNSQCADANPCTSDSCTGGVCVNTALTGTSCTDGDACTGPDTCQNGACVPGRNICAPPTQDCTASWSCTAWGSCVNGYQTRSCTCACPDNDCAGDRTSRRPCTTPGEVCRLTLRINPAAPRVGDMLSIGVIDQFGEAVLADLTIISPDGKVAKAKSPHSFEVSAAGTWQVVAAKDGCIGDAEEVKASASQMPGGGIIEDIVGAITGQPLLFGLVLLLLAVFLFLLIAKRRKKKEEEFEKI